VKRARVLGNWLNPNIPIAGFQTVGSSNGKMTRQFSWPFWVLAERMKPG
jgi:hypothetical protein